MKVTGEGIFMGAKAPEPFDFNGKTYPGVWEIALGDEGDTLNVIRVKATQEFILEPIPALGAPVMIEADLVKHQDFGQKAGKQELRLWSLSIIDGANLNGSKKAKSTIG